MDHLKGGATILISGDVQSENIHWHRTAVNGIIDDYDAIMVRGTRAHQRTENHRRTHKNASCSKNKREMPTCPGALTAGYCCAVRISLTVTETIGLRCIRLAGRAVGCAWTDSSASSWTKQSRFSAVS
jgi:hypothetical protein